MHRALERTLIGFPAVTTPEAIWNIALSRVEEIWLGVIVTIAGVFVTRITAIAFGLRGWPYA